MADAELKFREIYATFKPRIVRFLRRLVGDLDAEDLAQEVFVKVSHGLRDFRGDSELSTWIYRIATNTASDRRRSPSFQREAEKGLPSDLSAEGRADRDDAVETTKPSVEQGLIRKEMNECIRDFIEKLPESYRTAVILSELEGLKNNDVAEILGVTLHTAKIRLHRARAKLRKELETHCSFYRDERNELACDLKSAFKEYSKSH